MKSVWAIAVALLIVVTLTLVMSGSNDPPGEEITPTAAVAEQIQAPPAPTSATDLAVEEAVAQEAAPSAAANDSVGGMTPALPGVSGFRVPTMPMPEGGMGSPALLLEEEPEDEIWASQTRGQILDQVADLVGFPSQMEVVCRTTRCGVLLTYSDEESFGAAKLTGIDGRLKSSLNLNRCISGTNYLPGGVVVVNLYYQQRDGGGPPGCSLSL